MTAPPPPRRALVHVSPLRALAALVLLAGLFALFFLYLLPEGSGSRSVPSARMVDEPPGPPGVSPGVHPGELARDFEATGLDGLRARLSDLRGRPVVVNFWATWCTSCLAEMPALEAQRLAREEEDLAIVAVNVGQGTGDARDFIDSLGLSHFVIAMDPDLTISDAYGVRGLPHSVFVDANGVIQAEYRGALDGETLDAYVAAAVDAVRGAEPPDRLRIITTVPREHVLQVFSEGEGDIRFVSRRFRCDDAYCIGSGLAPVREAGGVLSVTLRSGEPVPELLVTFDPARLSQDEVVRLVAEGVAAQEDPLYTRDLDVRFPSGGG